MLGTVDQDCLFLLLDALVRRDGARMLAIADEMQARSFDFEAALQDLATLLHRIALAQTLPDTLGVENPDRQIMLSLTPAPEMHYQIALQGRADPLAPDQYAGFDATVAHALRAEGRLVPPVGRIHPEGSLPRPESTVKRPAEVVCRGAGRTPPV
jgi:DNA polymerase-3 subunit gamma/tau